MRYNILKISHTINSLLIRDFSLNNFRFSIPFIYPPPPQKKKKFEKRMLSLPITLKDPEVWCGKTLLSPLQIHKSLETPSPSNPIGKSNLLRIDVFVYTANSEKEPPHGVERRPETSPSSWGYFLLIMGFVNLTDYFYR